jgi:hypothetical protein
MGKNTNIIINRPPATHLSSGLVTVTATEHLTSFSGSINTNGYHKK